MNHSKPPKGLMYAERISLGVGIVLIATSLPSFFSESTRFFQSYLFSFLFWLELTLGSMAMLMVYLLTGGGWGAVTRLILQGSTNTIYLMVVLCLPIFFGVGELYPWADPLQFDLSQHAHKRIYFEHRFFYLRTIFYLVSWALMAFLLNRWLKNIHHGRNEAKVVKLSAFGLIFLGISVTWASFDWQMSLEPLWRSSIYGLVCVVGQALGAWALALFMYRILIRHYEKTISVPKKVQLDLGNLLLTLVILWTYLSFMQYLIVWSGNLPDEVTWFSRRIHHGWQWVILVIALFQFAAPLSVLLFRNVKIHTTTMIILSLMILVIRILDRYWMVMPAFSPEGISFAHTDATLYFGLGGLWIALFLWNLRKTSVFAKEDPNWPMPNEVLTDA